MSDGEKRLAGLYVLVVDDEIARPTQKLIENMGGRAVSATSIATAREVFRAIRVDVLLIDLLLMNGNGAEFIAEIRRGRPKFPCVLFSGFDLDRTELGFEAVLLPKPFSADQLADALLRAFERADTEPPGASE
ncbi:MAG TPA: response regulator [Polyangiaceae bacterium]